MTSGSSPLRSKNFDSSDRHHVCDITIAQWKAEIPQNTKLHGVRIETVVGILRIGAASEETLTCFAVNGLLAGGSFSVLHDLTIMAEYALGHRLILK